jgi:hypothetical protein
MYSGIICGREWVIALHCILVWLGAFVSFTAVIYSGAYQKEDLST